LEKFYSLNAALSGQKQWVKMCSEEKHNPLFLFRLNALLGYFLDCKETSSFSAFDLALISSGEKSCQ
jgi:hypothetical protein